uniref:Protein Wnt n=1 Tax=Romanomermis culicivorax TaxID=13658 RepID=A0A915L9K5_ROMCU
MSDRRMMTLTKLFLVIVLLLIRQSRFVSSNWLYLAVTGFSPPWGSHRSHQLYYQNPSIERYCSSLNFLNENQRKTCSSFPYAMLSVSYGARDSIVECQSQFRYERWNCTTKKTENDTIYDIFGSTLNAANREAAYLQAITSAGLVYWITKSCSHGNLTDCSCDATKQGEGRLTTAAAAAMNVVDSTKSLNKEQQNIMDQKNNINNNNKVQQHKFLWGGCSDNVKYGVKFSRDFLDKHERQMFSNDKQIKRLMAMHNYEVGREAVAHPNRQRQVCRCHGVSSSCEFRTCWLQMPKMSEVGEYLKTLYERSSVQVAKRTKKRLRRKEKSERKIRIRHNELVYLFRSPNYCLPQPESGVYGTTGRECNRTSYGPDGCDMLCCGRGYDTRVVVKTERCQCKFVWCCYVKCRNCTSEVDVS